MDDEKLHPPGLFEQIAHGVGSITNVPANQLILYLPALISRLHEGAAILPKDVQHYTNIFHLVGQFAQSQSIARYLDVDLSSIYEQAQRNMYLESQAVEDFETESPAQRARRVYVELISRHLSLTQAGGRITLSPLLNTENYVTEISYILSLSTIKCFPFMEIQDLVRVLTSLRDSNCSRIYLVAIVANNYDLKNSVIDGLIKSVTLPEHFLTTDRNIFEYQRQTVCDCLLSLAQLSLSYARFIREYLMEAKALPEIICQISVSIIRDFVPFVCDAYRKHNDFIYNHLVTNTFLSELLKELMNETNILIQPSSRPPPPPPPPHHNRRAKSKASSSSSFSPPPSSFPSSSSSFPSSSSSSSTRPTSSPAKKAKQKPKPSAATRSPMSPPSTSPPPPPPPLAATPQNVAFPPKAVLTSQLSQNLSKDEKAECILMTFCGLLGISKVRFQGEVYTAVIKLLNVSKSHRIFELVLAFIFLGFDVSNACGEKNIVDVLNLMKTSPLSERLICLIAALCKNDAYDQILKLIKSLTYSNVSLETQNYQVLTNLMSSFIAPDLLKYFLRADFESSGSIVKDAVLWDYYLRTFHYLVTPKSTRGKKEVPSNLNHRFQFLLKNYTSFVPESIDRHLPRIIENCVAFCCSPKLKDKTKSNDKSRHKTYAPVFLIDEKEISRILQTELRPEVLLEIQNSQKLFKEKSRDERARRPFITLASFRDPTRIVFLIYYVLLYNEAVIKNSPSPLSARSYSFSLLSELPLSSIRRYLKDRCGKWSLMRPTLLRLIFKLHPEVLPAEASLHAFVQIQKEAKKNQIKSEHQRKERKQNVLRAVSVANQDLMHDEDPPEEKSPDFSALMEALSCHKSSPESCIEALQDIKMRQSQRRIPGHFCGLEARIVLNTLLPNILDCQNDAKYRIAELFRDIWEVWRDYFGLEFYFYTFVRLVNPSTCPPNQKIELKDIIYDPLLSLEVDERVFSCRPILSIALQVTKAMFAASRTFFTRKIRQRKSRSSNIGVEMGMDHGEALCMSQESALIQLLFQIMKEHPELTECGAEIGNFVNQLLAEDQKLFRLVNSQSYPVELIPRLVEFLPILSNARQFILDFMQTNKTQMQIFAIHLTAHLSAQYKTAEHRTVCVQILSYLVEKLKDCRQLTADVKEYYRDCFPALLVFAQAFPDLYADVLCLLQSFVKSDPSLFEEFSGDVINQMLQKKGLIK